LSLSATPVHPASTVKAAVNNEDLTWIMLMLAGLGRAFAAHRRGYWKRFHTAAEACAAAAPPNR
jgi:hypothetical protein